MNKFISGLIGIMLISLLPAQVISRAEYWLDTDPGLGAGIELPVSAAADIGINFNLDLSTASNGLHLLGIRARNSEGVWSMLAHKLLFKTSTQLAPITYLEYFFDSDPGQGNGTVLSFTGTSPILCVDSFDCTNLENGLHFVYVRCKNSLGFWSPLYSKPVFKIPREQPPLQCAEIFFDQDPGQGNGYQLSLTELLGGAYGLDYDLNTDLVSPGMHLMGIRVLNEAGYWSMNSLKFMYISSPAPSEIRRISWYFTGNGADPDVKYSLDLQTPTSDATLTLAASIAHLQQDGAYQMHLAAIDARGATSLEQIMPFTVDFSPNNLSLSLGDSYFTLSWDEIPGAGSYTVHCQDAPSLPESRQITVTGTQISLPIAPKGFFSVTASSGADRFMPEPKPK